MEAPQPQQSQRFAVYVGNIPYQTNPEEIAMFFGQAGLVSNVRIIYDRDNGRSKGFGFCEFAEEAGAKYAVDHLNGQDFHGRSIRVNWANK